MLRKALNGLYFCGVVLGGLSMIAILGIIVVQMAMRWSGTSFPGATNYAGYFMAASIFFALADTLNHGVHIRVTLILSRFGRYRKFAEIWCYGVSAAVMTFFAHASVVNDIQSYQFNFISQGTDQVHLWIPQLTMVAGSILLAIALWDHLIRIIFTDHMGVVQPAIEEGME